MKHLFTFLLFLSLIATGHAQSLDSLLFAGCQPAVPVMYDLNKATLRPESKDTLDKVVEMMKCNDAMVIHVCVHTDSRASQAYCTKISQSRAQSIVDYLVSKGISPLRLRAVGYGETRPRRLPDGTVLTEKYINAQPKEAQEKLHQQNRRTELRLAAQDYSESPE